jgi:hypothetical protein
LAKAIRWLVRLTRSLVATLTASARWTRNAAAIARLVASRSPEELPAQRHRPATHWHDVGAWLARSELAFYVKQIGNLSC